jgi:hypothetical protein
VDPDLGTTTEVVPGPRRPPAHAREETAEFAATDVPAPAPVFVDASGQRRRLIRRAAIGLLGLTCAYGVAVVLSFLGGPVPPNALLPLPGVPNAASSNPATPSKANAPAARGTGNAAHAGPGSAGTVTPGTGPSIGRSGAPSPLPSPSASPSPTAGRRVPPGRVSKSASPGPSNGHGR